MAMTALQQQQYQQWLAAQQQRQLQQQQFSAPQTTPGIQVQGTPNSLPVFSGGYSSSGIGAMTDKAMGPLMIICLLILIAMAWGRKDNPQKGWGGFVVAMLIIFGGFWGYTQIRPYL